MHPTIILNSPPATAAILQPSNGGHLAGGFHLAPFSLSLSSAQWSHSLTVMAFSFSYLSEDPANSTTSQHLPNPT